MQRGSPRRRAWVGASAIALVLLAGSGLIWALSRTSPGPRASDAPRTILSDEVIALRARLDEEIAERRALSAGVALLRAELEWRLADSPELAEDGPSEAQPTAPASERAPGAAVGPLFDEAALVDEGVDRVQARRLRDLWEETLMEKLRLTDRAEREGWADTEEHRRELRLADQTLRERLGEDGYDPCLFALGTLNRVVVRDLASRSPGAAAGLLPGDTILRYDGQRVFATRELKEAIRSGEGGEPVLVEVACDGRTVDLSIPRGPFGAIVSIDSQRPLAG